MSPQASGTVGISTSSGLAGWLTLIVLLLVLFHFVGFRAMFTAGKSIG